MVSSLIPVALLFAPGSRPERFAKADRSGADTAILDLEDAVARLKSPVTVRVNAAGTPWHAADVDALRRLGGISIMLPKAERPQ